MEKEYYKKNYLTYIVIAFLLLIVQLRTTLVAEPDFFPEYESLFTNEFSTLEYLILRVLKSIGEIVKLVLLLVFSSFIHNKKISVKSFIYKLITYIFISLIIIFITLACKYQIDVNQIYKSIVSIEYINYFFIIYLIHPLIDYLSNKLNRKINLIIISILFVIYYIVNFFFIPQDFLFYHDFICYIIVYWIYVYLDEYEFIFNENIKINIIVFLLSSIILSVEYFYKLYIGDIPFYPYLNNNPLNVVIAISMFNILRNMDSSHNSANLIPFIILVMSIICDNYLIKEYFRVELVAFILKNYGTNYIVIKMIILAIVMCLLFAFISIAISKISKCFIKNTND